MQRAGAGSKAGRRTRLNLWGASRNTFGASNDDRPRMLRGDVHMGTTPLGKGAVALDPIPLT